MRALKYVLPLGLAVSASAASCNDARLEAEYDTDGGPGGTPHYDLAGADLSHRRNPDAACASVTASATLGKKPVDIIFVIDNSGSMTDEIGAVQTNINKNFADIITKSGLDYRVIMLSQHGDYQLNQSICVTAPLSGNPSCSPPPAKPMFGPRFFQYSVDVESTDSFRRILATYDGTQKDQYNLAPKGWSTWLRDDAFKVFIEITDDNSDMSETAFDTQLMAKVPRMFGTTMNRNYVFHTIAGLHENNPPSKAWSWMDPLQGTKCTRGGGAENNSPIYQKLSILTHGLRFPICEYASFDAVFTQVAMGVIAGAKVACDFPMPMAPAGEKIDPDSVILQYTPKGMGVPQPFKQVKTPADCTNNAFYLQNDRIYICPMACDVVQADDKAKVDVTFDCLSVIG